MGRPLPRALFSLLGARQHYEPMAMAQDSGCLVRLVTDFWNPFGSPAQRLAKRLNLSTVTRMADRYHPGIPNSKVCALSCFGIRYQRARRRAMGDEQRFRVYESYGIEFARRVIARLNVEHDVFWGYSMASLETLRHERARGVRTVLDQIDAAAVHYDIVRQEEQAHPELYLARESISATYFARLKDEWNEAGTVVVNSDWSRRALVQQGVKQSKIVVLPLPFRPACEPRVKKSGNPLRVLWLGTLSLGKGIAYAVAAARLLKHAPVTFTFVGPPEVRLENLSWPANCSYVGPVPRSEVPQIYKEHDIFLFPTLSDGFGLTQLEAAAYGLPVISTDCCADVVHDGVSGFVVPARDPKALAERILAFVREEQLLPKMSEAAIRRSRDFLPNRVWPEYLRVLDSDPREP
jgi:glycosyltransferase involved in cell wall biosynthesis